MLSSILTAKKNFKIPSRNNAAKKMFWLILVFKRNGLTPSRDTPLGVLESWCIWAVWSHVARKAPGDSAGIIHSVCEAHQLLPLCTMHPCTNLHDQQRERNLEERNLKQRERRDILWILQSSWFPCSCLTASKLSPCKHKSTLIQKSSTPACHLWLSIWWCRSPSLRKPEYRCTNTTVAILILASSTEIECSWNTPASPATDPRTCW